MAMIHNVFHDLMLFKLYNVGSLHLHVCYVIVSLLLSDKVKKKRGRKKGGGGGMGLSYIGVFALVLCIISLVHISLSS